MEAPAQIEPTEETAIGRAIKAAGGPRKLASLIGIRYQAVQNWVVRRKVPGERVLRIEQLTGVSRHELRPDLYPIESVAA